jgi:hypothetical protein
MLYSFFWGGSPASEFYVPTFRITRFHLHSGVSRKNKRDEIVGVFIRERVWLENSHCRPDGGVTGRGRVRVERLWSARTPSGGQIKYVREKRRCVGVRKGSYVLLSKDWTSRGSLRV